MADAKLARYGIPLGVGLGVLLIVWMGLGVFFSSETEIPRGLKALRVPEGFVVEPVAGPELVSYAMFGMLDEKGRLFISESTGPNTMTTEEMLESPSYQIRVLEDMDGDGVFDRSTVFADRIPLPNGSWMYRNSLYVSAAPDLLRLEDADGDGVADVREVVLTGWTLSVNGATLHGPFFGPDGWLYLTDARRSYRIRTPEGQVLEGKGPRIWRCRPDGTGLEWVAAGGFDNPVEVVFTPAGEMIGTMTYFTNPQAGQRDALMHWVEGGVYPKPHPVIGEDQLKRTGDLMPVMTRFARVAPSGLVRYRGTAFGPEYRGNLFSAHFNTHRALRHILTRHGATFRTEDEEFLVSADPDFHPTDVLEDADGSLLVIDTGGWFIKGCPLSRVTKPEFRGAIYRVRKKNAPRLEDPRGDGLNLEALSPAGLVLHLEDPRPAVQDRVVELAVLAGDSAVAPLQERLRQSSSPEVRCAALFALYRIGNPEARQAVREGLQDPDLQVRIAAARAAGMAKDREAVDALLVLAAEDEPPVRRQAATALGQIGEPRAASALLRAASRPEDRFLEHALIYSLILLRDAAATAAGLEHPSPGVRKAALIALDQMEGSPLQKSQLRPFLGEADPELRRTALWVASHHPGWSDEIVGLLRARLRAGSLSSGEEEALGEVLVAFSSDPEVQRLVAEWLSDPDRLQEAPFLLEVLDRCPLPELPASWVDALGSLLEGPDPEIRFRAIQLIQTRRIGRLSDRLERIANNLAEPVSVRVAALGALAVHRRHLSPAEFDFLRDQLHREKDPPLRLAASEVLGRSALHDDQLLVLARDSLPHADPLILNHLLQAFRESGSERVGKALLASLLESPPGLDSFESTPLLELFSSYPETVQQAAEPLLARLKEVRQARIRRLGELERRLGQGDAERGRSIFFGKKVACSSCHTIGTEGGRVGPDLTSVGAIRSRHDLLESILFPSASFVPGYESYRVKTAREVYSGVLDEQTAEAVTLFTGADHRIRIPRGEILSMQPSPVSVMPEGLDESLSLEELADLLAFLEAQTRRPSESHELATE